MNFLPQGASGLTSFTCNTCGIRFAAAELQRQHMKTDWHRYNLKRRVAQLPGISSETFAEKVLAAQEQGDDEDEFGFVRPPRREARAGRLREWTRASDEPPGVESRDASVASARSAAVSEFSEFSVGGSEADSHWTYESTASEAGDLSSDFASHESASGSESSESEPEPAAAPLALQCCFYCGKNSAETEANIRHMGREHGLYIPERTYLADLEGLLAFVAEVIAEDFECLSCGFEGRSLESIRQHMVSKGHCKIPYETAAEKAVVAEFYDFDVRREPERIRAGRRRVQFEGEAAETRAEPGAAERDVAFLANGSALAHRTARPRRPSRGVEAAEAQKTVALADRRFAPGLTSRAVTKQEKEMQRLEAKAQNLDIRRTKSAKANYQRHFRDEILGT